MSKKTEEITNKIIAGLVIAFSGWLCLTVYNVSLSVASIEAQVKNSQKILSDNLLEDKQAHKAVLHLQYEFKSMRKEWNTLFPKLSGVDEEP